MPVVSSRVATAAIAAVLAAVGVGGCASEQDDAGPLRLSSDDRLVAEDRSAGRIWRVYNDCAMARNTTWISDDAGKQWRRFDGPGFINCSSGSAVRIDAVSRHEARAEVDHGPEPVRERWRTQDGGRTWTMTSTDLTG